ncbi:MAG: cupin domain-containing protein [Betaproteobacteria bacterium]|nr:cupin domain-containing protein [Betaproteobacteria bacterium]
MKDAAAGRELIVKPKEQAHLAHHVEARLPAAYGPRLLHLGEGLVPGADVFITSRSVTGLLEPAEPNVLPHRHKVSQTYMFFSADGSLEVEVELEGKRTPVRAPASVFIPAGVEHALRILRGTGTVLSIVRSGSYE